jgi:hypothetical protein
LYHIAYTVRNTFKQFMELTLPPNASIWTVYVDNKWAKASRNEKGNVLISLVRSVYVPSGFQYDFDEGEWGEATIIQRDEEKKQTVSDVGDYDDMTVGCLQRQLWINRKHFLCGFPTPIEHIKNGLLLSLLLGDSLGYPLSSLELDAV